MTALLTESEGVGDEVDTEEQENNPSEQEEDFDSLFDDDNEEEEYKESIEEDGQHTAAGDEVSGLFGDVDDIDIEIEEEAQKNGSEEECKTLNKSREDLQGLFLCFLPDVQFWLKCPNAYKGLVLRGAQTHAGTDATAAAAAGSLPEGFQPIFRFRADSREVSWSQTQSEQGQVNHCTTEDGDSSR